MNKCLNFLIVFLMFYSCGIKNQYFLGWDGKLKVVNHSPKQIYCSFSLEYPNSDLSTANEKPYFMLSKQSEFDNVVYVSHLGKWKNSFYGKDSTYKLIIYVFDASLIENNNLNTIVKNNLILKKFEFTYNELTAMNWIINYNPNNHN